MVPYVGLAGTEQSSASIKLGHPNRVAGASSWGPRGDTPLGWQVGVAVELKFDFHVQMHLSLNHFQNRLDMVLVRIFLNKMLIVQVQHF